MGGFSSTPVSMSPASAKLYGGGGGGESSANASVSSLPQTGIMSAEVKALTRSEIADPDDSDNIHKDIQVYAST